MRERNDLSQFPRPSVSVDIAVLTALLPEDTGGRGSLAVLVVQGNGLVAGRALPGRFLRKGQTITEGVTDALRVKAGLTRFEGAPRLLRVFDDPRRDPRGWTLSLAHSLPLSRRQLKAATGELVPVSPDGDLKSGESLLFDHNAIVSAAAADIRARYEQLPDPDGLLRDAFTMSELRSLHESVIGEPLLKDTFRRRMEPHLEPFVESDGTPVFRSDGGRPAQVYARPPANSESPAARRRRDLPRRRLGAP